MARPRRTRASTRAEAKSRPKRAAAAKTNAGTAANKEQMERELDQLHQEMEIAGYARAKTGQLRRIVPKNQELARTQKRKILEKADEEEQAIETYQEKEPRKRLRGSMAAKEQEVLQGSLVFQSLKTKGKDKKEPGAALEMEDGDKDLEDSDGADSASDDTEPEEDGEEEEEGEDSGDESENDTDYEEDGEGGLVDPAEGKEDGAQLEQSSDDDQEEAATPGSQKKKAPRQKVKSRGKRPKRRMYRLKSFRSQRMAKRHGEALGAHARGQPRLAIDLLKQVARDAPSAPQIYSSLGMIYEDMYKDTQKKESIDFEQTQTDVDEEDLPEEVPHPVLAERLHLAKKAYGSYHVAAVLCRRDFTLWVRAADIGVQVAELHGLVLQIPSLSPKLVAYHQSERKRWYSEILRDFQVADNLKPPSIEVPAKLASIHIELGSLSDALTLLTDMKNKTNSSGDGRGEFHSSYKAWLLYADLMLRIGHECIQWNRGIQSNENYMFRRWLRKFSEVFDWQERRLQALTLALEAAAGTNSTRTFIEWMKRHVSEREEESRSKTEFEKGRWHIRPDLSPDQDEESHSDDDKPQKDSAAIDQGQGSQSKAIQFEKESQLMLRKQELELEEFDKTTVDMDVAATSQTSKDRKKSRHKLVKSQQDAIKTLRKEYSQKDDEGQNEKETPDEVTNNTMLENGQDPLPVSASCRQVCNIASELMKHLHGLELYTGVRLVAEAVSAYFKERASKYDRRMQIMQRRDDWQEKISMSPFLVETYDQANEDIDSEEEEEIGFLSDDEDFDGENGWELIESLRKGLLPPEIQVLYGLALVGEGGKNFLASKYLDAVHKLAQESVDFLDDGERETERSGMPFWYLFKRAMTEPLGRTTAFAFVADVLRKMGKEVEWANHFSSVFRNHIENMKELGLVSKLVALRDTGSPFVSFRKNQLLKIMVASCRFDINVVASENQKILFLKKQVTQVEKIEIAISCLTRIEELLPHVWKVEGNGSISSICLEVLKVVSSCMRWLCHTARSNLTFAQLKSVVEIGGKVISRLSSDPSILSLDSDSTLEDLTKREWGSIPLNSTWQTSRYQRLSTRAYNLTASCNVSYFSGWETTEFTLRLLRQRKGIKHFGLHLHNHKVCGYLPKPMEDELVRQWSTVYELLPEFPRLDLTDKLSKTKELDWYKEESEDRKRKLNGQSITRYQEDEAEEAYITFSSLCLELAQSEQTDNNTKNQLLHAVLSILFPVSEICVGERLWNSELGRAAGTLSTFDEWKLMAGIGFETGEVDKVGEKSTRRRKMTKVIEKRVQQWIKGADKPTLRTYVTLPMSEFKRLWNLDLRHPSVEEREEARECMEKVHKSTLQLRQCFTMIAIERASLQVAVNLLELASLPGCENPFPCLQQAAMFASQGRKAGHNDMTFRQKVPPKNDCTPRDALVILGRADCLHSVYFPNEAAYLCSYVASVCRLHRDVGKAEFAWGGQWEVVAIYAFNVSVMIRTTVATMLDAQMQKNFLSMWDRDVVEELERGRVDGWLWKRTLQKNGALAEDLSDDDDLGMEDTEKDLTGSTKTSKGQAVEEEDEEIVGEVSTATGYHPGSHTPIVDYRYHYRYQDEDADNKGETMLSPHALALPEDYTTVDAPMDYAPTASKKEPAFQVPNDYAKNDDDEGGSLNDIVMVSV